MSQKRTRAPNFSPAEVAQLLNIVEKYKNIIDCKKTDGSTIVEKQKSWDMVTQEFNETTHFCHRNTENLIACYKNHKSRMKKKYCAEKMDLGTTNKLLDAIHETRPSISNVVSEQAILPPVDCQAVFNNLTDQIRDHERKHNKDFSTSVIEENAKIAETPRKPEVTVEKDSIKQEADNSETSVCAEWNIPKEINPLLQSEVRQNTSSSRTRPVLNKTIPERISDLNDGKIDLDDLQRQYLEKKIASEEKINETELLRSQESLKHERDERDHKQLLWRHQREELEKERIHKELIRQQELLINDLKIKQLQNSNK